MGKANFVEAECTDYSGTPRRLIQKQLLYTQSVLARRRYTSMPLRTGRCFVEMYGQWIPPLIEFEQFLPRHAIGAESVRSTNNKIVEKNLTKSGHLLIRRP
jgi:hypothetical protein